MTDLRSLLVRVADHVATYREAASEASVFPHVDLDVVRAALGGRLSDGPCPAGEVVDQLVAAVEPAMVATTGPRYFGFVNYAYLQPGRTTGCLPRSARVDDMRHSAAKDRTFETVRPNQGSASSTVPIRRWPSL